MPFLSKWERNTVGPCPGAKAVPWPQCYHPRDHSHPSGKARGIGTTSAFPRLSQRIIGEKISMPAAKTSSFRFSVFSDSRGHEITQTHCGPFHSAPGRDSRCVVAKEPRPFVPPSTCRRQSPKIWTEAQINRGCPARPRAWPPGSMYRLFSERVLAGSFPA